VGAEEGESARSHGIASPAYCVAFDQLSPQRLATGHGSGLISVWGAEEQLEERGQLAECRDRVGCLVLRGTRLMAGSWDHHLRVWDLEQGVLVRTLGCKDSVVTCLDERRGLTLSSHEDAYVKLWDDRASIPAAVFKAHSRLVSRVAWNPRHEHEFLSCSYDGLVKVWDTRGSSCQCALEAHQGKVFDAAWHQDAIISGGADSRVALHRW
jgi:WD40 repeat protein